MILLKLMSRPDCPLCDDMLRELQSLLGDVASVEIVDITEDESLMRQYVFEIPVLLHGDRELSRHRLDRERVARYLDEQSA